ncbi:hypothetical protein Aspvir_007062 [Aspergillus viridinutans]|uniref:Uncharacterized protein n=1 Tax=Aspergillus viridinutans TaxID=75553 RepID=A0A9P3F6G5_ASPVI|nr:uncharacterized protein Aspvir_007062 [Aspergillus viridinutans]GIK02996.1 hypothetical protein Aspvir_007062 [Aspergillus viridinutans]
MSAMASNPLSRYPPSNEELRRFYIGRDIGDVPKPAVVLDVAIIKRHCQTMLQTVKQLGVAFRAHIKTLKTPQIARLQAGTESSDANFVVSTVAELETQLPLLQELQAQNRRVNVLYGIPLAPSQQLETNAQRSDSSEVEDESAISVIAEVCSVYNEGERDKPEALVAAGTLAQVGNRASLTPAGR